MIQRILNTKTHKIIIIKINNADNQAILKDLKTKNNPPIKINIAAP